MNKNSPQNQQFNAQAILELIIKRRWFIIWPVISCLLVSVALGFILPKQYEASSTILVSGKQIVEPLTSGREQVAPDIRDELNALSKQVLAWPKLALLVTQLHLSDHLKNPRDVEQYIKILRDRITIYFKGNQVVQISYSDRSAARAQLVVNTITQNFIDEDQKLKREEARNAIDFIAEQLKIFQNKLESSQKDFSSSKLSSDLRLALNKKSILQDKLDKFEKIVPSRIKREPNPIVGKLEAKLGDVETELTRLMIDAKEGNPKITELRKLADDIKAKIELEKSKESVITESTYEMNPSYFEAEQDLKQVDIEIKYLQQRMDELAQNNKKSREKSEEVLVDMERNKKVDEDIYQMLRRQLESALVSERLQDSAKGSGFTVIEYARLPLIPVKPNKQKVMGIGLLMGLALGSGLVFMIENLDQSFRTSEDAKNFLTLEYLGAVSRFIPKKIAPAKKPLLRGIIKDVDKLAENSRVLSKMRLLAPVETVKVMDQSISERLLVYHQPKSRVSDEFKFIKTNIENLDSSTPLKTILVTSALSGEGKTTTAINLAVLFANSGKKTVIVDFDTRKGTLHEFFSYKPGPGVIDVLEESCSPEVALQKTKIPNLSAIFRGSSSNDQFKLFEHSRLDKLIDSLKGKFDIIILDSPPVLNIGDSGILTRHADGTVLVVQAERVQRKDVVEAQMTLEHSQAKMLGFVLTNIQFYMPASVYNYYYGY
jgi:capsular exopolysaccharide synthesis family protein